jgi:hypothetical protein
MRSAVRRVLDREPGAVIPWMGRRMAAARVLFIWGRRPDHRGRVRSHADQATLVRLQALLSGY